MGKKGSVGQQRLVLELDLVPGFVVPHTMLEDHNLQHLLGFIMVEPAIVDKGHDVDVQGVDAFIKLLVHIQEELISEVPEVVIRYDGHCSDIQYLPGCLLLLLGDGPFVNQGLESLPVVTLKHHLQLLLASLHGVSFFGIDVKGLQEVNGPGIKHFPVL